MKRNYLGVLASLFVITGALLRILHVQPKLLSTVLLALGLLIRLIFFIRRASLK